MYSTESECGTYRLRSRLRSRLASSSSSSSSASSLRSSNERSRSLPRHYQQAKLMSTSTMDLSAASYDYRHDTLYVTKGVALILSEPLVQVAHQVLFAMQKYISKSDYDVQVLEGLIYNLLHDIPIPTPGRSVRFWCLGEAMTLSMPKVPHELPLFDYNLLEFFDILGVENAIKLLVCTLLENQILVYSSDFDKLMLVCESVVALMYPFNWQHVYVPILPPNLENFLDAPVPYIMGLLRRTHDIELSKRGAICILDIDSGELELPEELPDFPHETELAEEVRNNILRFGGKQGADVLKEHAIETREIIMEANDNNVDTSDTMQQLNQMISRFESLSSNSRLAATPTSRSNDCVGFDRDRLNNAIREVFVNRFAHMFLSFDHFVIVPTLFSEATNDPNMLSLTPQQQETQQNFDKISFLSDQRRCHLAFLSSFLETQTFSTFIDEYIVDMDSEVILESPFLLRLNALKERFGESLIHTPTYEPCDRIDLTDEILQNRLKKVELTVTPQKSQTSSSKRSPKQVMVTPGVFPHLDPSRFESKSRTDNSAIFVRGDRKSKSIDPSLLPRSKISMLNSSPAAIAETNWKFVNQLLAECKNKTKRILLEKLGQEAVEWGHGNVTFSGSEENMLVASVCDLIERIWSHGLQNRTGKSSLWHFLYKYGRANERMMRFKGSLGQQAFCVPFVKGNKPFVLPDHARNVQVMVNPLKKTSTFDSTVLATVHNVASIREIKTEIGYARAWVRLALERKCLSQFLHILTSDPILLKNLYKRYAFLRCDDEREQAFFHLQTLTTVEFSCFTNAYTNSSILYQVLIFPSGKSGTAPCSSHVWLQVVGSYSETAIIEVPKGAIHFSFWAKNLGVITSLRLGHDNFGSNPNWLVEHVLIRNEFTGQAFKFICGRWLGTGIDDGSTERYMVGYPMPRDADFVKLLQKCANPPVHTLPPMPVKSVDPENEAIELQTMLGDAINRIIKFHHKSLNEKISYAHLMCGEFGLVHALLNIFSFGFKSARLFGRNLSVWDFFLKVTMDFNHGLATTGYQLHLSSATNSPANSPAKMNANTRTRQGNFASNTLDSPRRNASLSNLLDSPKRSGPGANTPHGTLNRSNQFRKMYTKLITRIDTCCPGLGKDDKFQLFVCLAAHDRLLGRIITDLTKAVAANQLYEDFSFLRKPKLSTFLSHILEAIQDISVPVDPAMNEQHNIK